MKNAWVVAILLIIGVSYCFGQMAGNSSYGMGNGRARVEETERNKHVFTKEELPPTAGDTFVEANVLMNVKADEYVAVFAVIQEAETLADCGQKVDATIKAFTDDLKKIGIGGDDLYVDFIAQNKVFGYEKKEGTFHEKLVGFELKKNVSIHFKDRLLIDQITQAAARSQIFDLVKVDYVIKDVSRVQDAVRDAAARVLKHKMERYENLLGIKLLPPAQVYAERPAIHYPTDMYDSYTAFEAEAVTSSWQRNENIVHARKNRTTYFNGLNGDGFDEVINPVMTEPVVQFTLYLKVKYEVEQTKAK